MIVKGEKLSLKKISHTDITDNVISWFNDKQLMKFYTNSQKKIDKNDLIKSIKEGEEKGNLYTFGIFYNDNNSLIGTIKLGPINEVHKTSDLVALIGDRNFLGKGLSVEAIKLGNQLAFEHFKIRKLYGGMYESNVPSIKAYHRAGWIIEGRLVGQFLIDGKSEDRILVGCFNPFYFDESTINILKNKESLFYDI